jgi:tripartite-type tricarboxylate transporter receptor subunit TctC
MAEFGRRLLLGGSAATLTAGTARAQGTWPERGLRVLVGFAAGGSADVIARLAAQGLAERLGRPVVVENRPGAGGRIAAQAAAQAEADGYTLLLGSTSLPVQMALDPTPGFDPPAQLLPVALLAEAPNVLVCNKDLPVGSVAELIALARSRPQGLNYASSGAGTSLHLSGELLRSITGAPMTHVPYRGSGPALTALVAGEVQFMFDSLATSLAQIRGGAIRALALTANKRSALLPETPTMREAGFSSFDISVWFGLFAPRATPAAIAARLATDANAWLADARTEGQLAPLAMQVQRSESPAAFERFFRTDIARWQRIVRDTGVTVAG